MLPISLLQKRILLLVVSLAMFMELLDGSALNASLPQIALSLHQTPIHLKLAITIYLFAIGVLIPLSGYFVERFGTRKVMLSAFAFFIIGSMGCGLSHTIEQLVIFRAIQGMGGAFMMPVGRLAVARVFGEDIVKAMTTVTSISLFGPMMGPVLGGFLTTYLSWHWIFFINVPFSFIAMGLIYYYFPAIDTLRRSRFDWLGFLMLFIGVGLLLVASDFLEIAMSSFMISGLLFSGGLLFLMCYVPHARSIQHPIISLTLFKNPRFTLIAIGNFLVRFSIGAFPFIMPIFLYVAYNLNAFQTGLAILPVIIGTWLSKFFIVRLLKWGKVKRVLLVNTVCLSLFQALLAWLMAHFLFPLFILYGLILGCLNSIQFSCMNSSMFLSLDDDKKPHGNALYLSLMQLGSCFGVSLAALIMTTAGAIGAEAIFGIECAALAVALVTSGAIPCFYYYKRLV